jgi:hypothetical protein
MPVDATRRIRVARLRGRSEPLIRRGALLLEDALRTASLPYTEHGRLLLIRSLSLGVIHPNRSAALVAQQLEQQVAELARHAVHGAEPRAAAAAAVFFHDRLDAVMALIQRVAQGASGDRGRAWYWRQAVPGWQSGLTPDLAGRVLLGCLLNLDPSSRSLAQAFQRLLESDCLDVVLQVVRESDGPVLLQRSGWRSSDCVKDSALAQPVTGGDMPFPRLWQSMLSRWIARWGPSDLRSLWLVALAVQSWRSEAAKPLEVLGEANALLRAIARFVDAPLTSSSSLPDEQALSHTVEEIGRVVRTDEAAIPGEAARSDRLPMHTAYAGFWFLIPLLMRAGFGRAAQDHPEWVDAQVPWHLLRSLSDRLAIQPDDPVRLWLSDGTVDGAVGVEPERDDVVSREVAALVALWRVSMRRWCRLKAHLGLADVVRRPGWVSWSKTHVEVRMPLNGVDLRIRRAGLDLDPGWVPWLGRVIRFYYEAEGRPHGAGGIAGH